MKQYTAPAIAIAALLTTAPAQAIVAPPLYTLTYNAADGTITIDPMGNPLYNYVITGTGAFALDDGFLEANHILIPDAPGSFASINTSSDDELSQSDFDGWLGLGPTNLGDVLPAGLTEQQFNDAIDPAETKYVQEIGSQLFINFDLTYEVPEPGSLALLGVGAALFMQRRRRDR